MTAQFAIFSHLYWKEVFVQKKLTSKTNFLMKKLCTMMSDCKHKVIKSQRNNDYPWLLFTFITDVVTQMLPVSGAAFSDNWYAKYSYYIVLRCYRK